MKSPIKKSVRRTRKARASASLRKRAMDRVSESKELSALVKNMFRQKIDQTLIRRNVRLSARLCNVLGAASPNSTVDLVSGIAVDLADFWEIGEEHRQRVKKLLNMKFPKDRKRLEEMLYELDIRLVMHAEWHAKHLKKRLAKFKHDLTK